MAELGADLDDKGKIGATAMLPAARGDEDTLEVLLKFGANPNESENKTGLTPLMIAVSWESPECVRMLLDYGADKDAIKKDGTTVYEYAQNVGSEEIITIKPIDITNIMLRRKIHIESAIEIFLCNGKSYFINFFKPIGLKVIKRIRRCFYILIPKCQILPSFQEYFAHTEYQKQWIQGQISNFDYLMKLNIYSGRSFNDPGLYPLLPWIVSKFDTEKLDINDPSFFRDLSRPVGAIGEERLQTLLTRLADLAQFGLSAFLYSSYLITPLSLYILCLYNEIVITSRNNKENIHFGF